MKKVILILMLAVCLAGCKDEPEGTYVIKTIHNGTIIENVMDKETGRNVDYDWVTATDGSIVSVTLTDSNYLSGFTTADHSITLAGASTYSDIMFSWYGKDIEFNYEDGKIDVVYDVNDLTGSAQIFCEAMEPYLNQWIEDKAKLLCEEKENE